MIMKIMRKKIHDALHTVDALLTCITREDFSDEEFEAIKDMTDRIEHTILIYHIHDSAPPSEATH